MTRVQKQTKIYKSLTSYSSQQSKIVSINIKIKRKIFIYFLIMLQ